jgi:hypothetical protein
LGRCFEAEPNAASERPAKKFQRKKMQTTAFSMFFFPQFNLNV